MMAISSSTTRLLAMVLVNTVPVFTASLVLHTRLAPLDNHRPVLSARSRLQPHQPPLHLPPRLGVLLSQRLDLSLDGCPNLVEAASEIPVQLIEPRLQGVIALPLLSQPLTEASAPTPSAPARTAFPSSCTRPSPGVYAQRRRHSTVPSLPRQGGKQLREPQVGERPST